MSEKKKLSKEELEMLKTQATVYVIAGWRGIDQLFEHIEALEEELKMLRPKEEPKTRRCSICEGSGMHCRSSECMHICKACGGNGY